MNKLKYVLSLFALIITPFIATSCSCGLQKYKSQDIKDLYKTVVEYQIDPTDGKNTMFSNDYTIYIEYAPVVKNISIENNPTDNEYNLYALENIYNELFKAIFRYYENWNENFYESADERLSVEDFNNLYEKLNNLHIALIDLSKARANMEAIISKEGANNAPSYAITSYIYVLNDVVDKAIDFVTTFRDIHVAKIFTYDDITLVTVSRTVDDMLLSFANLAYVDNIMPFTTVNGNTKFCDISLLVEAYRNNNEYVKFYALSKLNTMLNSEVVYALDNPTEADPDILNQADQYMYYSKILRQNILTLDEISANINYYRLSLYRFGVVDGGVLEYSKTISSLEYTSYQFLDKLEDFIQNEYMPTLNYLT